MINAIYQGILDSNLSLFNLKYIIIKISLNYFNETINIIYFINYGLDLNNPNPSLFWEVCGGGKGNENWVR